MSSTNSWTAKPEKIKVDGVNLTYEGLIPKIQKSMLSKDVEAMQPHIRRFVGRAITFTTCPHCTGAGVVYTEFRGYTGQGRELMHQESTRSRRVWLDD